MATLLIDIRDVTTQPIKGDTVTLTAPAPRPATGGGVTRPFNRLVTLVDGKATVEVDPGPLRVTFHDGYGREVVIDTRVPDDGDVFTLRDLIVSEIGDLDDVPGIREALAEKSEKGHEHAISDVSGLQVALDGKADEHHEHQTTEIVGLGDTLDTLGADLNDKADARHTHAISDVSGLQVALDGKAPKGHTHSIADVKDLTWSLDQKVSVTDLAASTRRYASEKIAELVDGAPESLDTLREVAEEFKHQDEAIEAVFVELSKKLDASEATQSIGVYSYGKLVRREPDSDAIRAGTPTKSYHAATVGYVDEGLDGKLDASEATQSIGAYSYGKLVRREPDSDAIRAGTPTKSYHAATVGYVDEGLDGKAAKSHTHAIRDVTGLAYEFSRRLREAKYISKGTTSSGWTDFEIAVNQDWAQFRDSTQPSRPVANLRNCLIEFFGGGADLEFLINTDRQKIAGYNGYFAKKVSFTTPGFEIRTVGANPGLVIAVTDLDS